MGVGTARADGKLTVFQSGMSSSRPMANASIPKEVKVVQLRRERCVQEVSSKLSANIPC
jgi:hypothetical protein